jgi:pimeloyl-ACP methyl ester carboxylesterase
MALAHAIVTAPPGKDGVVRAPERWMLFLHGILGSGANWRTFAKQIIGADPSWGAVLVDLRLHGESLEGFAPPHTVAACARDIKELIAELEAKGPGQVRGVLAHSFGGKVALELAKQRLRDFEHVFIIDSTPSARPDAKGSESTKHIVDLLGDLPSEFANRAAFMAWIEERGVSRPTAMWLAMNVRAIPNTTRFVFRIDLAGIRELLADYFRTDLWDVLEHPPGAMQAHLVVGGKSGVVDAADREHAKRCPQTTLDVIAEADHWVHVDAPDALRAIVLGYLAPGLS